MAAKNGAGTVGLRLTMPGAPATWHHLPDYGVWVHPVHVTPCGGLMEITEDEARRIAADPTVDVELVDVKDAAAARVVIENHLRDVRGLPPIHEPTGYAGDESAVLEAQKSTTKMEA